MTTTQPHRYIVTGAGNGIGEAVAQLAVEQAQDDPSAVSLALVDRDKEALDRVADGLSGSGATILPIHADLEDPDSCTGLVERTLTQFGGLDCLVSNAGVAAPCPLVELDLAGYDRAFDINTRPTWLMAKAAHAALAESRGSVVATASVSGSCPTPPLGTYSASKAALIMLIQQMAIEWGVDGIRVNCVSPGYTDSALSKPSFGAGVSPEAEKARARREAVTPLRKIGSSRDVAQSIMFLAGPAASHITGMNLIVDGGSAISVMAIAANQPAVPAGRRTALSSHGVQ